MNASELKKELSFLLADNEHQIEKEVTSSCSRVKISFPLEKEVFEFFIGIIETIRETPEIKNLRIKPTGKRFEEIKNLLFKLSLLRIEINRSDFSLRFKVIGSFGIVDDTIYINLPEEFNEYVFFLRQVGRELLLSTREN
jgi:hypothetical protein